MNERRVVALAMASNVLVPLNSTMIAVALPAIVEDLGASVRAAGWLVTGYLVVMALLQPFTGRLGDRVDRRALVGAGLAWFGLASLGAGLAPSMAWLLVFRFQQAAAGAILMPNTAAMVRAVVPVGRRATTVGFIGTSTSLAAAVGPTLGGLLLTAASWRIVFVANVLPIVAALIAAAAVGRVARTHSPEVVARRARDILRTRAFTAPALANGLGNLGLYTLLLAIPLLLARRGGWSSARIGLVVSALTAGLAVCSPVGGRLADRLGRRTPPLIGMGVLSVAVGTLVLTGGRVGGPALVALLALAGMGIGLAGASLQTAALEAVEPQDAGSAAGMFSTARYIGSIVGSLVLAQVVGDGGGSFTPIFAMAAVAAVVAVVASTAIRAWPDPAHLSAADDQYARAT